MPLACKICIVSKGLKGSDVGSLPQTEEELAEHIEREHHTIVIRVGETKEQALRRVLAKPETCSECVASIEAQLEELK